MGTCKQLSGGVDMRFDSTSYNNTSGKICDGISASGSIFDIVGVSWKQCPPVVIRIRSHPWGGILYGDW